jgi:CheY-like chemotaxis protein
MLLKGKHIFIVEDNVQNRVVFKIALLMHGAMVDFERSGEETIQRLQSLKKVDLIILDLMLRGGISGFALFEAIRRLPQFVQVPIIAVSAAEPATAIPLARKMGFSGFIAKPIDDDLFPKQIAAIIGGEQIWHVGERI